MANTYGCSATSAFFALFADVETYARKVLCQARPCRTALVCGVALGLACFPMALAAFALLLIQVFETSYATAFLMAVVAGAAGSVLLCVIGWLQVRKRVAVLRRSQQELVRNLRWIKKVLERSRITRGNNFDNSWRTVT